ncbi:MAG TPA: RNA polymerase factor sigma-54, partial [Pirellulales bacterium]|nr:RNA polymerase factor sigma-54 [Pirellulales bacterium]
EILQLPIQALQERIEQEIQENPCLDILESDPDLPDEEEANQAEKPDAPTIDEKELVVDENRDNKDDFERLMEMDQEWPDHFEERTRQSSQRIDEESDRKHDAMANMAERPQTLHDYLHDQLSWYELSAPVRAMCDRIIYNLNPNGYLQGRLEDLLDPDAGPEQLTLAQEALSLIQKLDPPGVGARDARECLLLQLKVGMPYYQELHKLISNHLEDLEYNRLPAIQRKTNYSIDTIQAALEQLRHLNPHPGANFTSAFVPTVTPDVFLEQDDNGKYKVRLEDGRTPSLYISPYYRQRLQSADATPEEKEYIKRKINSAQWLIESIEQRRNTLTRVAQAIVEHQTEFLNKGPEHIEPLKMQQIADKVKVHVTTVSRAVDDKWIQTPRGLYPLKKFFVGGTMSAAGEEVAWDAVRLKLHEIVDKENKQAPYSDDDLVKELAKHGLTVARRTVTKYRKAMNIPSSRQRRDWALGDPAPAEAHLSHESDGAAETDEAESLAEAAEHAAPDLAAE